MISERLKEIREKTGMNKKEFADYIGLKYTTYNNYETGTREPASDFLILISRKFDVSIDYILGLQTEKEILHSYKLKSTEYAHIEKYRSLDLHGKDMVDTVLNKEFDRCEKIKKEQQAEITSLPDRSYLEPVAAHERTDIEVTGEMRQYDDDLMNNNDLWK